MFGTIRRHQNWLWIVIIAIIVISFVVFFSPEVNLGGGGRVRSTGEHGSINGQPVADKDFYPAYHEARVNHFFRTGQWPGNEESAQDTLKRDALSRVFLVGKLKELDIKVSDEAVARLTRDRLPRELADNLGRFVKEYLEPNGSDMEILERYLRHETGIQQLVQVASSSAKLLQPREAEMLFRKENERLNVDVALFWASNYLDRVAVTNDTVNQYYTNNMARYRVPERLQIAYVPFHATNYFSHADKVLGDQTNLNKLIENEYFQKGPDTFKDDQGNKLSEEDAKAKIKDDVRHAFAITEALRKANEFGTILYNEGVVKSEAFEKLAADKGFELKVTEPFDRIKGLEDGDFPSTFRQKAFSLTDPQPVLFSPIRGSNTVYVIGLKKRVPSEMQPFDQVKDKVLHDYKYEKAREMARQEGQSFQTNATNGVTMGKSFADLAAAAKVSLIAVPEFTPATSTMTNLDERINFRTVHNNAADLKKGQVSNFVPLMDGGLVIYMRDRQPVSEAKVKEDLPDFLSRLRLYRQNEAFNQWFRKEAEQARVTLPQKETPPQPQARTTKG
jgi:parvulin-like peptidyl-prolyl isomerase